MTLVYCGSLASVHGLVPACPSRMFCVSAYAIFLAQIYKHSLASVLPTLSNWSCRSDLVVVSQSCEDCLIELPIGITLQPASVVSHTAATGRAQHNLISVSVVAGRLSSWSQVPLRISGQKPPVKAPSSSLTLL